MAFPIKAGSASKAPAQGQEQAHMHASKMAFAAGNKVRAGKALSGGAPAAPAAPSPGAGQDYRAHIASAIPNASAPEIHQAIGGLVQQGKLTPFQGQSLVQHQGPLHGPAGAKTVHSIATQVLKARAMRPAMPMAPARPAMPMAPQAPQGGMAPRPPAGAPAPMPARPPMGAPGAPPQMGGPPGLQPPPGLYAR